VVPRFQFTAVARNRLRRRLKEILRRQLASLPAVDLVVRAKRTAYTAPFATLLTELTESVTRVT
jgi:ribonuclease P protein component